MSDEPKIDPEDLLAFYRTQKVTGTVEWQANRDVIQSLMDTYGVDEREAMEIMFGYRPLPDSAAAAVMRLQEAWFRFVEALGDWWWGR